MHEQPPNRTDDVIYTKPLIASVPRGAYRLRVKTPADPPLGAEVQEFAAIGGKNFKLEPQRLLYSCNGSTVRRPTFICSSCAICSSVRSRWNLAARRTHPLRSAAVRKALRRRCGLTARR
jgi:hypothetical protein